MTSQGERREESKTETIAIINERGGVGKTTTAAALGSGLTLRGYKVLFVDMDASATLSYGLGVADSFFSDFGGNIKDFITGEETPEACLIHNGKSWDIIPGSAELSSFTPGGGRAAYLLKERLAAFSGKYDYVIIDTPPVLGYLTILALTAADSVIIPAKAEAYSLQGIGRLAQTLDAVRKNSNPALTVRGILLTMLKGNTKLARYMVEQFQATAAAMETTLYRSHIRETVTHAEAALFQRTLFEYAPTSPAADDYNAFIDEFLAQ